MSELFGKIKKMKILLVAAMPTESEDIITRFGMKFQRSIVDFFPYYSVLRNDREVFLVQTHVGSINAPAAVALALKEIKPDFVIKVGCVGGNSPGVKKNDIVVPISFFHSGAWITKSFLDNKPTSDASLWQRLYGEEPYQNSKDNLGGLDFTFVPDEMLNNNYRNILKRENITYIEANLGSGDMVIFDHKFMDNIRNNLLKTKDANAKLCTDNESYAIAQVCQIFHVSFTGVYFVASSDYEDVGGYNPDNIQKQTRQTILPIIEKLVDEL